MLLEEGSFEAVECRVAKYQSEEDTETMEGGYFSKVDLEQAGWTESHGSIPMFVHTTL